MIVYKCSRCYVLAPDPDQTDQEIPPLPHNWRAARYLEQSIHLCAACVAEFNQLMQPTKERNGEVEVRP